MHTVIYEMHDFGCIELILIIFLGFVGNLSRWLYWFYSLLSIEKEGFGIC